MLMGIVFYLMLPYISVFETPWYDPLIPRWLACSIFAMACFRQYRCHLILSLLRLTKRQQDSYYVPTTMEFEWISCPHYFYEIVIYACIALMFPCLSSALLWIFVCLNQMDLALKTHAFYHSYFPRYPKERKAIIPGVL